MRRREQPVGKDRSSDKKDKKKKHRYNAASTPPPNATLSPQNNVSNRKKASHTKRRESSSSTMSATATPSTDSTLSPQAGGESSRKKAASTSKRRESSSSLTPSDMLFEARRSTRVDVNKYSHDGDSWQETLAVCEMPVSKNGLVKMKIRSYYSNRRTGERVWDEPPSGASKILPATEEMRKMAEVQLQEMQITFGTALKEPPPKKKGFFRKLTSSSSGSVSNAGNAPATPKYKIKYKPDSILSKIKKESASKTKLQHDDSLDPEVQKAIALSMNESGTSLTNTPGETDEPVIRSEVSFRDDEMQMVMAMSLSEAESKRQQEQPTDLVSEEVMLQRALQESRQSTSTPHVAALPVKDEFSDLGLSQSTSSEDDRGGKKQRGSTTRVKTTNSDDSSLNKKMPAKPTKSISVRDHRNRAKEGAVKGNGKTVAQSLKSASSRSGESSLSSLDKKMPAKPTKSISVRDHQDRNETAMLARDKSGRKAAEKESSAKSSQSSSLNGNKDDPILEQAIKTESKGSSAQKLSSGSSGRALTREKSGRTQEATSAVRVSKARPSQSLSSGSSRPTLNDGKRDSKTSSSQGASNGSSRSSLVGATSDSSAHTSRQTLSGNATDARSAQSASSGSSRSSLTTDGSRRNRSDRQVQDSKPSGDSSDTQHPTKPAPSASSKRTYGKSVRPASSRNLTIARSTSSGSRRSLSSAREQAPTTKLASDSPKSATPTTKFSPYTDNVKLSSKAGVTIKQCSESRSAGRSLFGGNSRHQGIDENVSMAKAAMKKQSLNGVEGSAGARTGSS